MGLIKKIDQIGGYKIIIDYISKNLCQISKTIKYYIPVLKNASKISITDL